VGIRDDFQEFRKKRFRRGRPTREPKRDTWVYPQLFQPGGGYRLGPRQSLPKPTPRNLRYFSRTPFARRAINAIKNPIVEMEWEIVPKPGVNLNSEVRRQIETVTECFQRPNNDDSFRTLLEQTIEDVICGAGAIEIQPSGDQQRPLWMWATDGLSIHLYPAWAGGRNEARYCQVTGFGTYTGGGTQIDLRNDELIYIRPNSNSSTPFGTGALEVAFTTISRQLATAEFVGNLASNQRPSILMDLGDVSGEDVAAFRAYWQNEVEGQGKVPIVGFPGAPGDPKTRGVGINRLYPEGDGALYLKYQEFLIRTIACSFDISPQNLSIESDVNRNTSEVSEDRDWQHAIRPMAALLAAHFNRDAIEGLLGFSQVMFRFKGIDREDEEATSRIMKTYYEINAFTPNQILEHIGHRPSDSAWADKHFADVEIAKVAARGVSVIDDPDLDEDGATGKEDGSQSPKGKGSLK
jgi:hypothetical protein